jgi:hypothetical protein
MTDITYHVGEHVVKAVLQHYPETWNNKEFCNLRISLEMGGGVEVSVASFVVDGTESHVKDVLSAIKAAL